MARKKVYSLAYRRKREGKTDYKKRFRLLMAEKPRLVVRRSNRNMLVQVVRFSPQGDKVLITAHTHELGKLGWNFSKSSIPAAYLAGYLAGNKAVAKGIKDVILDIGMQSKGHRLYAALKGAVDAGLKVPHDPEIVPGDDMINGGSIKKYVGLLSKDKDKYARVFSGYSKHNLDVNNMPVLIKQVKEQSAKK